MFVFLSLIVDHNVNCFLSASYSVSSKIYFFNAKRTQDKSLYTSSSFNCISLQKPVSSCDNIKPRRNGSPTSISSRCVSTL